MSIGQRIANLREKRGMSQLQLAEKLGYSQSSIAMWESGKRRISDKAINDLADFFNVSTDYLYGRDIPSWATSDDVIELEKVLDSNVNMSLGGENLTKAEEEQVRRVIEGIFWEKLEKIRRDENENA